MATLKQIRQRIRTAKSIQQITRAMKLVAAARLTRAKNRVEEARPYADKMREFVQSVASGEELPEHPLLERRGQIERYALILLTAERGLAGSYNTNIIRKASDFLHATKASSSLVAVGRKGAQFFSKRGFDVLEQITLPTSGPELTHARQITEMASELFTSGRVDAVYLCYSKFFSPIRQEPQVVQLLPIEPPKGGESSQARSEFLFEPGSDELLKLLLPKYLLTLVNQALLESAASEHGARMTSMSNATDNAGKMIDELTLKANRERQANITREILEVVGGAEALGG